MEVDKNMDDFKILKLLLNIQVGLVFSMSLSMLLIIIYGIDVRGSGSILPLSILWFSILGVIFSVGKLHDEILRERFETMHGEKDGKRKKR
jgi:hypothetical protein